MDAAFDRVLSRYSARLEEEMRMMTTESERLALDRDQLLLPVGEEAGRFLHALIVARGATRILELGTSYGYSTLFLADAARQTGGKVVSMDVAADKQEYARRELEEAGLDGFVEFRTGDAIQLLNEAEGPFEFVLLDIWKNLYIPCFEAFRPNLADNAIVAADNMIMPPTAKAAAEAYRQVVREADEFQTILLPIGSGIELSCVWRSG
jgi:predicted O-methyltransferase YrrM